mmetsp:Transcript_6958/g.11024  ORF Transcript_6958/g.11024 Transcript_6958/m.11024 type:complete len:339 (-) Transcript_6958:65-1081(-)
MSQDKGLKFFLVTGCDTGFGNMAAQMLDREGYSVFAGCFTTEAIERHQEEGSKRIKPFQLDVTNDTSITAMKEFVKETLNSSSGAHLCGLVNNAGLLIDPTPTEWTPLSSAKLMMEVNYFGTVRVTQALLPFIRKSQGRIVNVASIAGKVGLPSEAAYCASKYAVEAYSDVLRKDMLPFGVNVTIIEPGIFPNTGLYGRFQTGLDKVWEELDEDMKKDYGHGYYTYFRKALGIAMSDFGTTDTSLVPKAMIDALTSDTVPYRAKVGLDSKYLIPVLAVLPEFVQDLIMTHSDSRAPYCAPASGPPNGKSETTARYRPSPLRYWFILCVMIWAYRRYRK